jgi:hypothetical protein
VYTRSTTVAVPSSGLNAAKSWPGHDLGRLGSSELDRAVAVGEARPPGEHSSPAEELRS